MILKNTKKFAFLCLGWLSLCLGFLGIFLPLLPTTPFIILSIFCFSKSSEKIHAALLSSRLLGPGFRDWEQDKIIKTRIKITSTIMIFGFFSATLIYVKVAMWIKVSVAFIGGSALLFIWTRASSKPQVTIDLLSK